MKNKRKKVVSLYFDEDKWQLTKKKAQNLGISASAYIRQIVYANLNKRGENVSGYTY